jgi:hypothetical protein
MVDRTEIKSRGLKWRNRTGGPPIPYWVAKPAAIAAGYPTKTVNLSSIPREQLAARCCALEAEMLDFLSGRTRDQRFDGTLGSLLKLYQTHEDSPYRLLKQASAKPYTFYLRRLIAAYGDVKLAKMTGLDVKHWHKVWVGNTNRLASAKMALAVLKAALTFGRVVGIPHCDRLRPVLGDLRLPGPKPRTMAPTAEDVEKLRAAAHAAGKHRAAFAYALQFETTARQWDIIGQWVPLSDLRPSGVIHHGRKWIGPTWAAIDANLVLTLTPTKTERSTGAKVAVDLSRCPMVMTELTLIPQKVRSGPLVVNEGTGRPYVRQAWEWLWQAAREAAGLSPELWNRDLRAGGITEGQMAGAAAEDRAKMAGHSTKVNQRVYARDRLVASNRVIEARGKFRRGE